MISNTTKYYGVLGYPTGHSKSPYLFNKLFQKAGMDAVYLFLEQENTARAIEAMRSLRFSGASVTIPHKIVAYELADEIDAQAQAMGCVNTLHFDEGKLKGYNFDGKGALEALDAAHPHWQQKNILIIGNGGAAQAIAAAMRIEYGIEHIHLLVRSEQKAKGLCEKLAKLSLKTSIHTRTSYRGIINENIDVLINTTPVGMHPHTAVSPFPKALIRADQLVYDIVYVPQKTQFLKDALAVGAKVIYGVEMFLGQAAMQYHLWTGAKADKPMMRKWLEAVL